ncbi:flagellar hook-associated protein FlgL [bacterium]|nr:flagellar hook-associated protein FlgL [bacterium]
MAISRVSTYQSTQALSKQLNATQAKFNKLTQQISSGVKVSSTAENPVAARGIIKAKKELENIEEYKKNIELADNELSEVDDTLVSVGSQLTRAKDLAMQVANGTVGAEEIKAYQSELNSIIDNVKSLANTKYGDQYIFAGTRTETVPYEENAAGLMYNGDYGNRYAIIGEETTEPINMLGIDVFGQASFTIDENGKIVFPDPDTDSKGIFGALYQLKAAIQDVENIDTSQLETAMKGIDDGFNTSVTARTKVGAISNGFDDIQSALDNDSLNITELCSNLQDTDLPSAISDWYSVYQSMQASYSMMSQTMNVSLLNYI